MEIIGTYPILNSQNSSIDENGIQTLSYVVTVKTGDVSTYLPVKDDEYYGPANAPGAFDPRTSSTASKYLVTQTSVTILAGGLSQLNINTVGSLNIQTKPKVRIIPNKPLLFGLNGSLSGSPIISDNDNLLPGYIGVGNPISGYGVEVSFITESTQEAEGFVFANYFNKLMPSSIFGTDLPVPAKTPFFQGRSEEGQGGNSTSVQSTYYGFLCSENAYQRVGGVSLFRLIYTEKGFAIYTQTSLATTLSTTLYDFR